MLITHVSFPDKTGKYVLNSCRHRNEQNNLPNTTTNVLFLLHSNEWSVLLLLLLEIIPIAMTIELTVGATTPHRQRLFQEV